MINEPQLIYGEIRKGVHFITHLLPFCEGKECFASMYTGSTHSRTPLPRVRARHLRGDTQQQPSTSKTAEPSLSRKHTEQNQSHACRRYQTRQKQNAGEMTRYTAVSLVRFEVSPDSCAPFESYSKRPPPIYERRPFPAKRVKKKRPGESPTQTTI